MSKDVKSVKRRLSIIEKVLIVAISLCALPLGLAISTYFVYTVDPLSLEILLPLLPSWIIIFLLLIFLEFLFKNIALYKGFFKATLTSIILSYMITFSVMCIYFVWGSYPTNYAIFASISALCYVVLITFNRLLLIILNKKNKKIALIIGPRKSANTLAHKLIKEDRKRCNVKYIFYEEDKNIDEDIFKKFYECNTIILLDDLSFENKQKYLLFFNSNLNKDVFLCSTYFDIVLAGNTVTSVNDMMAYEQKPLVIDKVEAFIKRIIDIFASSLILILSFPIWLFVPLIIKLQDGGPVFYKQVRLTKDMKEFNILKFRSMRVDAEKDGAQLAKSNDSRITKFGKFIRATRIDEIPQVLNVFKGDMSLVGPRPERPEFVKGFLEENPLYKYRFNVKAGVTGLQQVSTTYHTTYDDKLRYDLYYIANFNTLFDILILFLTVKTVLSKSMAEGVDETDQTFEEFLTSQDVNYETKNLYYSLNYDEKPKEKAKC